MSAPSVFLNFVFIFFVSSASSADLSSQQQSAVEVVKPLAQQQVPGAQGLVLAECIILASNVDEVVIIADSDPGELDSAIVQLVNEIIQRPDVLICLNKELAG
ncbi:MAG: hypothetical protein RI861_07590, partial [Planktomarina sp.]|nr:hypothetical protein [Planktomarina sp.]